MRNIKGISDSLSQILLEDAETFIEQELDKALREILIKAKLRVMQNIQFTIREDLISDRMVMTLEVKKKENDKETK